MATKRRDQLTVVIKEIEAMARRLRTDVRRAAREVGLTKNLEKAAAALRKQVALLVGHLEKYVHELRMELSKAPPAKKRVMKRRTA